MRIINCKTNHLKNPIGYNFDETVITWAVADAASTNQEWAQVKVFLDSDLKEVVFDTGKKADLDNRGVQVICDLNPCTRYYWQVTVKGDKEEAVTSDVHYFETGKMNQPWKAQWITVPTKGQKRSPYIRKTFHLDQTMEKARAYITGFGLYTLEINGVKVGNELLTPYCNAYDAWIQYQTYDISDYLVDGDNTIGVMLGNGWAKGPFGTFGDANVPYINDFALLCELQLTNQSGQLITIGTDTSWQCHESPVLEDSIYDGEIFDAREVILGWSNRDYDSSHWDYMVNYELKNLGPVTERMSPPVIIKEEIKPIKLIHTKKGEYVLDMGQNMVGWIRFTVDEPIDQKVQLSYGEILQDGCFYRDNLRKAKCEYTFISDGNKQTVLPHFTFYGFRYVKLEGFTRDIHIEDFTGCVIYTDLDTIGDIKTSDPLVNRLFLNALWGQKGNFLDVPTDCPQRDERMGWTGDAQVFSGTACFNMDAYPFYAKFLRDLYEEQKMSDGMVASTVPTFGRVKYKESSFIGGGACGWSDAATIIPWEVYVHTGDITILKQQYQSMKDWVDWVIARDIESGDQKLWLTDFQFGDWLALDGPVEGGFLGGTDTGLLASTFYKYSTEILGKAAKVLGFEEDAAYYSNRAEEIRQAVCDMYFTKTGRCSVDTQTARVIGLHFGLFKGEERERLLSDLVGLLKENNMHLKTGFLGTPYLCRALSNQGASQTAYDVFLREDYPSWLYEVKMGATTIWERWNSVLPDGRISGTGMNSLNHYAYGSIVEWMYRNVCGIKPMDTEPGFKSFIIQPEIDGRLTYAGASLMTPMGEIVSKWEIVSKHKIKITITVPFNANAKLILDKAIEGSVVCEQDIQVGDNYILGSGTYEITYETEDNLVPTYDLSTPLWALAENEHTRQVLEDMCPHLLPDCEEKLGFLVPYSIREILAMKDSFMQYKILRGLDTEALEKALQKVPYEIRGSL